MPAVGPAVLIGNHLLPESVHTFIAGRALDKLKLLVCPRHWNKAVIFAVFTTVVVALDALVILVFLGVLQRWLSLLMLPTIACNFCYLVYLRDTAKFVLAMSASQARQAGNGPA